MDNSEGKYDERNRFWTEQALNQFGSASNFFFLICLGYFAYLFEKNDIKGLFTWNLNSKFSLQNFFLIIAVLTSTLSLIAGSLTVLSRLHDLRLTRHIVWIRKKSFDNYQKEYNEDDIDIDKYYFYKQFLNLITTVFSRRHFIKQSEIKYDPKIDMKFLELRKRCLLLARFSWKMINTQFLSLLISLILYSLYNLF
ncbi:MULTISPECIES: hypothetical protein [Sphingobacterium]|uniref:hypothetical protein n=1 Tax=Sphingobacterium TaxID=28453 RepID=UPI0025801540|nr:MULTISPECIES: hypothetical protein [Sphingobacterium]